MKKLNTENLTMIFWMSELILLIAWLIYFIKYSDFYREIELLISDNQHLVNKLLIFVTYSKEKSVFIFLNGFVLIFLLLLITYLSFRRKKMEKAETKKYVNQTTVIFFINSVLVLLCLKPIVYPLFILFIIISFTILFINYSFNTQESDEKNESDNVYEYYYEERYEE